MAGKRTKVEGEIDPAKDYTRGGAMKAFGYGLNTLLDWEEKGLPWYQKGGFVRYRGRDLQEFGRKYADRKSPNFDATERK